MEQYRATTNQLWLQVFRKAGLNSADAKTVLNLTLNIVRGMAVNRLWQKDEKNYRAFLKNWVGIVQGQFFAPGRKPLSRRITSNAFCHLRH